MLSKKEFITEIQGTIENDDCDVWADIEGIQVCVPHEFEEKKPYELSYKLDEMPLDQALNNDLFNALYENYLDQIEETNDRMEEVKSYLEPLIWNEDINFINDQWIDTQFRWLYGNKYLLVRHIQYEDFERIVNEIKKEVIENEE